MGTSFEEGRRNFTQNRYYQSQLEISLYSVSLHPRYLRFLLPTCTSVSVSDQITFVTESNGNQYVREEKIRDWRHMLCNPRHKSYIKLYLKFNI